MSTLVSSMPPTMTEVPSRTCPHCGFEERSDRERCSRCGRSVLVRAPRLRGRRRRMAIWGGAAVALVVVAVIVLVLSAVVSNRNERERKASAKAVAAERVRLKRLQAPHRGSAKQLAPRAGASDLDRLAARALRLSRSEAPAGGASCVAEPRWGACRRPRRMRSAATALADALRSRSLRWVTTELRTRAMAATARTPAATLPQRTSVRRRPRSRGARTRTDFPQLEQRSRPERSSKPQWGHVRVGTSVIVGGIG